MRSQAQIDLDMNCREALSRLVGWMRATGWQVIETFNLQNARAAHGHCPCPQHGITQCSCQLLVLQVLPQDARSPATLMMFGQEDWASLTLVDAVGEKWTAIVNEALLPLSDFG